MDTNQEIEPLFGDLVSRLCSSDDRFRRAMHGDGPRQVWPPVNENNDDLMQPMADVIPFPQRPKTFANEVDELAFVAREVSRHVFGEPMDPFQARKLALRTAELRRREDT